VGQFEVNNCSCRKPDFAGAKVFWHLYHSAESRNPMDFVPFILAFVFVRAIATSVAAPVSVRVLVLDALDGKPQGNVVIQYYCDEIPHSTTTEVTTDATGIAVVPYTCRSGNKLALAAVPKIGKEGCGGGIGATLDEIRSTGVVSHPDSDGGIWCPTKISRKLTPVPGQVTLFVKKPTWWQAHVAG
jgi:hypothetical protein